MRGAVAETRSTRDEIMERNALRSRVEVAVENLSRLQLRDADVLDSEGTHVRAGPAQQWVRFFGQVLAAWPNVPDEAFPDDGAGFGATVHVEDVDTGAREAYTLMTGALLDIDAGQVSLASPIGQALLGVAPGAAVAIDTPQRVRRLRVLEVRTLQQKLQEASAKRSAA